SNSGYLATYFPSAFHSFAVSSLKKRRQSSLFALVLSSSLNEIPIFFSIVRIGSIILLGLVQFLATYLRLYCQFRFPIFLLSFQTTLDKNLPHNREIKRRKPQQVQFD